MYDVFLSYRSTDFELAQKLASALRERSLRVFFDKDHLNPGDVWLKTISEAIASSSSILILEVVPPPGIPYAQQESFRDLEVSVALDLWRSDNDQIKIIPLLLGDSSVPLSLPGLQHFSALDRRSRKPDSLLFSEIASLLANKGITEQLLPVETCPYPGMLPFEELDGDLFFGRERETDKLLQLVTGSPIVALVGNSGVGKSSLIRAGLVPALRRSTSLAPFVITPGSRPLNALIYVLLPCIDPRITAIERLAKSGDLASQIVAGSTSLGFFLSTVHASLRHDVLLIFDPWDDFFRATNDDDSAGLKQFRIIKDLIVAIHGSGPSIRALLSVRSDYMPHFLGGTSALASQVETMYLVSVDRETLRDAIVKPAESFKLKIDDAVVSHMVESLSDQHAGLPLAQFVLRELWLSRVDHRLTWHAYEGMGKVDGAVAAWATKFLGTTPQSPRHLATLASRLVLFRKGFPVARRRAPIAELSELPQSLILNLINARLIVQVLENGEQYIEFSHQALLETFPPLRLWIEQHRDHLAPLERLQSARAHWLSMKKSDQYLLTGGPLAEAISLLRTNVALSKDERHYIELSQEKGNSHLRRAFLIAAASLMVLGLAVALFWLATKKATVAKARSLLVNAERMQVYSFDRSLLLALEASKIYPEIESRLTLLSLLSNADNVDGFLPKSKSFVSYQASFDRSGKWVATSGPGHVEVFDTSSRLPVFSRHEEDQWSAAISPNGTLAIADTTELSFENLARTAGAGRSIPLNGMKIRKLLFAEDQTTIAGSSKEKIYLWDIPSGGLITSVSIGPVSGTTSPWVQDFSISKDARLLAAINGRNGLTVWQGSPLRESRTINLPANLFSIALEKNGRFLAIGSQSGSVDLWSVGDLHKVGECGKLPNLVSSLVLNSAGDELASGSASGDIYLWRISAADDPGHFQCKFVTTYHRHVGIVWGLGFSGSGQLVSGGTDDALIVWRRPGQQQQPVLSLSYSPTADLIVLGSQDGRLHLVNLGTGREQSATRPQSGDLIRVAISPDGKQIASSGKSGEIVVAAISPKSELSAENQIILSKSAPATESWSLGFRSRDSLLAVGSEDGKIELYRRNEGRPARTLDQRTAVSALAFSPDGTILVTGDRHGEVRIWRRDGEYYQYDPEPIPQRVHSEEITAIAFSQDGERLATGGADKSVQLWNVNSGSVEPSTKLLEPASFVQGIAFSPDDRLLAAVDDSGRVYFWETKYPGAIGEGIRIEGSAKTLAFSADGEKLIVGGEDGLHYFDLDGAKLAARACRTAGRNLTTDETSVFLGNTYPSKTCPSGSIRWE